MTKIWKTRDARRIVHTNADPVVMRKAVEFSGGIRLSHVDQGDWKDIIIFPNLLAEKMYRAHFADQHEIKSLPPFQRHLSFYAVYEDSEDGKVKAETLKHRDTVRSMQHHSGNVVAINMEYYLENVKLYGFYQPEAYGAMRFHDPNTTMLSHGAMTWEYVWRNCKRIPFRVALDIHPALFAGEYLDEIVSGQEAVEEK
jgi:hypothetical protein